MHFSSWMLLSWFVTGFTICFSLQLFCISSFACHFAMLFSLYLKCFSSIYILLSFSELLLAFFSSWLRSPFNARLALFRSSLVSSLSKLNHELPNIWISSNNVFSLYLCWFSLVIFCVFESFYRLYFSFMSSLVCFEFYSFKGDVMMIMMFKEQK